ncbi:hypothetical protein HUA74_27270 [Myxococcus sp. CA051A]|uniref:Lipoprotein n=2 Tax=Myxococcus TaxID=32 RepID=A0A540X1V6_9BACT|nr:MULTISPECIES: hypothetical protein [Myxococcus]NTX09899.1 hypothetical protein [Myxococcus sp. CA056]NTX64361.1 hypothetical protein [Myxococcus sp. CA051A]TQF15231.1 hypothetical protein FJV41_14655 [Myxococcus llanfairpwllgwyngyllgogerychwyrndrobwllllantysiliogogogochensis]
MRRLLVPWLLLVAGCPRAMPPRPIDVDPALRFPEFFAQPARGMEDSGSALELDGVVLKALMLAANDFLPSGNQGKHCWERQDARLFRFIREGDIIFIRMDVDPSACDGKVLPLDSGAAYAVHVDGRILRRVFDGEPGSGMDLESLDAGTREDAGPLTVDAPVGSTWGAPSDTTPARWLDGGVLDAGTSR